MFIESVTGVTEKKDIQIQKSCKAIAIVTTAGAITAGALATLKLISPRGEDIIYDQLSILDLMEIMAQGEGLYIKDTMAAAAAYPGTLPVAQARTVGQIPVTRGNGSYRFAEGEYLSLDLINITAGTVYRISAIEDLEVETDLQFIEKLAIPAPRTSQEFATGKGDYLAIPKTNFDKIQMYSADPAGNNPTFTYEELVTECILNNDIAMLMFRTIATTPAVNLMDTNVGLDNLVILSLEGVSRFEIYCTGAAGFAFYRGKYEAPDKD